MGKVISLKKIISALVTLFIVIVSISAYLSLRYIEQTSLQRIDETLQVVVKMSDKTINTLLNKRIKDSIQLASNPDVINLTKALIVEQQNHTLSTDSENIQKIRALIIPQLREFDEIGFGIVSRDKVVVAGVRDHVIGMDTETLIRYVFPDKIDHVLQGDSVIIPPISVNFIDKEVNENESHITTLMFAATPIIDENNNIIAGFFLSFNPMVHFSAITEMANLGDTGESYFFDKDALLISKTRYQTSLLNNSYKTNNTNNLPQIRIADPGRLLTINESSPTTENTNLPLTFMASQAIAKSNGINMDGYRNYRGKKVFGAWHWIDHIGIGIAVEISEKEGLQFFQLIQNVVISVVITCFLLVLIMLRIMHNVQMNAQRKLKDTNIKLENRVTKRTAELTKTQEKLLELNKELETLAITDGLTLLPNRRFFDLQLEKEWQRCLRDNKSIAIILFDIDHFKRYNDHYGHVAGDACLKQIGNMLNTQTFAKRPSDVIARYGGEEFVVLLSNATQEYTKQVAENICKHVEELNIAHEKTSLPEKVVTVSVGSCITSQLNNLTPSQLIQFADQALYQAKNNDRNNSIELVFNEDNEIIKV